MLSSCRILVSHANRTLDRVVCTALTLALAACGQQGPLYLPTEPAAANRATLLQTLLPRSSPDSALQTPAPAPAVSPAQGASTPSSAPPSR